MLHLAATPDTEDTFCPLEDQALREVVAATYLGGPLLPTVQAAVVHAKMVRGENWKAEAHRLLGEFGAQSVSTQALMHRA
jgi:hypothetical protein